MNQAERLNFLKTDAYLGPGNKIGSFKDVATIDEKIFSLPPDILENEIQEFCKKEALDAAMEKLSLADKEFCNTKRCYYVKQLFL